MNKLLKVRVSPNTKILVQRENEPMLEVQDIQIMKAYESGEDVLVIIPKFDKENS